MASYARQANDEAMHLMADRVQARAIRRCGELPPRVLVPKRRLRLASPGRCTSRRLCQLYGRRCRHFIPSARMPEFHNITPRRTELPDNGVQPRPGVPVARRKLKQEAAHPVAQDIGDQSKILDEGLCTLESLHVGNELTDLDRVNVLFVARLATPVLDAGDSRPRIKRRVDLDGIEVFQIVFKPIRLRHPGVEGITPFPIAPAGHPTCTDASSSCRPSGSSFFVLRRARSHFRRAAEIDLALLFTAKPPAFAALLDGEVFPLTGLLAGAWFVITTSNVGRAGRSSNQGRW
jgi:hypothetical protein